MLMRVVKKEADRRIQFLIADKSMKRRFIGAMAGLTGVVPVGRAMDMTKPAEGKIYLPDPISDPTLLRGVGTNFEDKAFQIGGSIVLPKVDNKAATAEILEIRGPEEIRLKRSFKGGVAMRHIYKRRRRQEGCGRWLRGNSLQGCAQARSDGSLRCSSYGASPWWEHRHLP
jgi:glycerol-3-phosphate O-acyltransferase/dihydroxyacetone phosphate acyltransferase